MAEEAGAWTRRGLLGGFAGGALGAIAAGCSSSAHTATSSTTHPRSTTSTTTGTLPPRSEWRKVGSLPDPSKPEGTDLIPEIDHIVVVMQENHSFDSYFGMLGRGDGYTLDGRGQPINSNPYGSKYLKVWHATDPCQPGGVDQSWNNSHVQYDGGTNQGFANSHAGVAAMSYYDGSDIPFYWSLGRTFPLCDRYFSSVLGQTYPNRRFMMAGSAWGLVNSDSAELVNPAPNGTIFDRLDAHGISWKGYKALVSTLLIIPTIVGKDPADVVDISQFHSDAAAGTLPAVSFVDSNVLTEDEENPQDLQLGEAFVASIVSSVLSGPKWERTMLIWTYDEGGGYYDHVPPPPAIPPDGILPKLATGDQAGLYDRYGFRVPTVVVSGRSRKNHVSHTIYDHTSILRTIENKWNIGALSMRDANAHDLFDCLDLTGTPPFAEPPRLAQPANTTGVSACTARLANPATAAAAAQPNPPAGAFVAKRPGI